MRISKQKVVSMQFLLKNSLNRNGFMAFCLVWTKTMTRPGFKFLAEFLFLLLRMHTPMFNRRSAEKLSCFIRLQPRSLDQLSLMNNQRRSSLIKITCTEIIMERQDIRLICWNVETFEKRLPEKPHLQVKFKRPTPDQAWPTQCCQIHLYAIRYAFSAHICS